MTYRASTIKRDRWPKATIETLDAQIVAILVADHPQSVRHVFYRMTDPRLAAPVEKSELGYRRVQDRCVKLRRSGAVPYPWIADMSRRGYFVDTFVGADDFLRRVHGAYRADPWSDADCLCEVWTESRSIASVLVADCQELAVALFPCGGFSSLSFVSEAATLHNQRGDNRPLCVIYIGDFDQAGVLIDRSLERELRIHLRQGIDLTLVRLAINEPQIACYELPTKPRKATDRRAPEVRETVEAEAMPAHILRGLVRDYVESLLPAGALQAAQIAEQAERGHLLRMAEALGARA